MGVEKLFSYQNFQKDKSLESNISHYQELRNTKHAPIPKDKAGWCDPTMAEFRTNVLW